MFWLILIPFFSVLIFLMIATNPGSKLIQNKNTKRYLLDFLLSSLSGFLFIVIIRLFEAGRADSWFSLNYIFRSRYWSFGDDNFENFIFAFIITYIIIFIRNQYKKT